MTAPHLPQPAARAALAPATPAHAVTRLPDWPVALDALVRARAGLPFAWGKNDCISFAADAVRALTGADPLAALRGSWHDPRQAQRLLDAHGGLESAVTGRLGAPLPPHRATVGDVLLLDGGPAGRSLLAVCIAPGLAAAPGPAGLQRLHLTGAGYVPRCAWIVGGRHG